ncbi:MAG: thioredoxin family protein [Saprospiraceae bacterium]|nr:thioredoxin family protein [Saprospiraceae bacterium]
MSNFTSYLTINEQQFGELLSSRGEKPFLVVFTADWLGEGTIMDSIIEGIADDYRGRVGFFRMDIEQSKNISNQLGIRRLPAIYLFKNGEISDHLSGIVSGRTIEARMNAMLG